MFFSYYYYRYLYGFNIISLFYKLAQLQSSIYLKIAFQNSENLPLGVVRPIKKLLFILSVCTEMMDEMIIFAIAFPNLFSD